MGATERCTFFGPVVGDANVDAEVETRGPGIEKRALNGMLFVEGANRPAMPRVGIACGRGASYRSTGTERVVGRGTRAVKALVRLRTSRRTGVDVSNRSGLPFATRHVGRRPNSNIVDADGAADDRDGKGVIAVRNRASKEHATVSGEQGEDPPVPAGFRPPRRPPRLIARAQRAQPGCR